MSKALRRGAELAEGDQTDARELDTGWDRSLIDGSNVGIVIPARNEAEMIGVTLQRIRATLPKAAVCVVDDYSDDETQEAARAAEVAGWIAPNFYPPGYGYAVYSGLQTFRWPPADRAFITIMAADGSDSPWDLQSMLRLAQQWRPIRPVFGDRWVPYPPGYPRAKFLLNRLGNRWIDWRLRFWRFRYGDWTNPFKLYYRTDLLRVLDPVVPDMSYGMALAIRSMRAGANPIIMPNTWRERVTGQSKFRLSLAWAYWRTALRETRRDRS